jgi:hypothetical protein
VCAVFCSFAQREFVEHNFCKDHYKISTLLPRIFGAATLIWLQECVLSQPFVISVAIDGFVATQLVLSQ